MTETIPGVVTHTEEPVVDRAFAQQIVDRARAEGVSLIGPGGVLADVTKLVLETALDEEMTDHLGYEKRDADSKDTSNERNGKRPKTVITDIGPVTIDVPRDRAGTFEPTIVKKRQRRLDSIDNLVLSLSARGLTHGEIAAHFSEVYGSQVSKETLSRITDKVIEEMTDWCNRPLDRIYPVIFIDAIVVKVRDGQVTNKPFYVAIGVTTAGERDILGIWAGQGGEGAKYWLGVLTELKNRGIHDVFICCCDGLKGLPDAIRTVWEHAQVQTCVIHLLRNTFRYTSKADWDKISRNIRPVYTAPTIEAAEARFEEFAEKWSTKYGAAVKLWRDAWAEFIPFLDWDIEIRKIICTTNSIESLNA